LIAGATEGRFRTWLRGALAGISLAFIWALTPCCLAVDSIPTAQAQTTQTHHTTQPIDPGIWISTEESHRLPTKGRAWDAMYGQAKLSVRQPNLSNQNDPTNVRVLARALIYARTGDSHMRSEVEMALERVQGTENGATALAVSRELMAYIISAELIALDSPQRARFEEWLRSVRDRSFKGRTIRSTHEDRPNNWGTHAGASRIALAIYLGDDEEVAAAAKVFRGWLGEPAGWQGFVFGAADWQAEGRRRYAVNPPGAKIQGYDVDGVLPDDQRRGGKFSWPPPKENYVYEALQGAVVQAALLARLGYPSWKWGDRGIERAFDWLQGEARFPAVGDDTWLPYIVNRAYDRDFPAPSPSRPGKGMGFSDWTHGPSSAQKSPASGQDD
jgi:hypothetical protein